MYDFTVSEPRNGLKSHVWMRCNIHRLLGSKVNRTVSIEKAPWTHCPPASARQSAKNPERAERCGAGGNAVDLERTFLAHNRIIALPACKTSMPIVRFPDISMATPEGIVAVGGDLHPDSLQLAYGQGIFPWPHTGYPLLWFCPDPRAILEFDRLHVSRSLRYLRRQASRKGWTFTVDHAFDEVVEFCAGVPRFGQSGTWITSELRDAYQEFHRLGHAHSAEAWLDGRLAGGIYGVDAGGAFAAESMFHLESNASNLALLHLIDHLAGCGLQWMDIQVLSPHLESLGARAIGRSEFLAKLAAARERGLRLF